MKNSVQYIIIIILAIFTCLYFFKPKIVNIHDEVARIDSFYFAMDETAIPDSVKIVKKWVLREKKNLSEIAKLKHKINNFESNVIRLPKSKMIIEKDTVYVDTTKYIEIDYCKSYGFEDSKLSWASVTAFALCPVDSFQIKSGLNREAFAKQYAKTVKEDNIIYWLGGGLIVGLIIGGLL